eukprot:980458-Amphidinium_carterae.1
MLKAFRKLASKNDQASRSVLNAACGGLWMDDRRARAFDGDATCVFCKEDVGTPQHVVFECPAFKSQRKEAKVGNFLEEIPACVQTLGLGVQFPQKLAPTEEAPSGTTPDTLLFTDGSGKHPAEPTHRKCGCGVSGETTRLSYPLPGCWQSVYKAELHAIMTACERLQGRGVIVTDCKGAAVVANKLKIGVRKPRGRHSRVEQRILASIGEIEVQWMRSHQTPQQAEAAGLPAAYLAGNAEADLLAGEAVQDVPALPAELGLFRRAAAAARSFW